MNIVFTNFGSVHEYTFAIAQMDTPHEWRGETEFDRGRKNENRNT